VIEASPADRRILRAAIDGGLHRELAPVEDEVRTRVFGRWLPVLRDAGPAGLRDTDDPAGRAVLQGVVGAVFGIADQAGRDGLDPDVAIELAARLITALVERRHARRSHAG